MRCLLAILLSFSLASCGFYLRGAPILPPALHVLYLESHFPYSDFTKELHQSLQSSGVQLTEQPQAAPFILEITNESQTKQLVSAGNTQNGLIYQLNYVVNFQIKKSTGQVILYNQSVIQKRIIHIESNELLANSYEIEILYRDMRHDLIFNLMDRLTSARTNRLFSSAPFNKKM